MNEIANIEQTAIQMKTSNTATHYEYLEQQIHANLLLEQDM